MRHIFLISILIGLQTALFLIFGAFLIDTVMPLSTLREILLTVFIDNLFVSSVIYGIFIGITNGLFATLIYRRK